MLKIMPIVYYVFAAFLVAGGGFGSIKSKEPWSILGSAAFGAVAVVAGLLTRAGAPTGLIVGLVDALALAAFFGYRYANSGKAMPAFPSIALGLIVAGLSIAAMNAAKSGVPQR